MAFLRVMVLIWADLLATYVMWIMQTYLTDVWQLGFTHAAGIMNIASGLPKALPMLFYCFVNVGLGNKWMLLLSSFSYVIGLGLLSISTPPVLYKTTGTCKEYEPECIGHSQRTFFYIGLAFTAAGISGHIVSLVPVFSEQFEKNVVQNPTIDPRAYRQEAQSNEDRISELLPTMSPRRQKLARINLVRMAHRRRNEERSANSTRNRPSEEGESTEQKLLKLKFEPVEAMLNLATEGKMKKFRSCLIVLVPVIAIFVLPYIKPWSLRFGIPAICALVATLAFLSGFYGCKEKEDISNGNPVTNVFKVIFAATLKIFKTLPSDSELYGYNANSTDAQALPHTPGLWLLDKAAIEEGPNTRRGILCTVTQVEETKIIIFMIPIWITLILCGVVTSIGSTYFVEQANHMNYHLGKWRLPDSVLLILYEFGKITWKRMCSNVNLCFGKRNAPRVGIALATVCATLCCIVAAVVETERRQVIRDHGLVDKPEEKIPMTIFYLLPQYFLLAGLDSFYENSVTPFLNDQSPPSMQKYLVFLNPGLSGVGIMGSVVSVLVVGRVSQRNGNPGWFQPDLNGSRLDLYFWTLAGLSAVNFVWFVIFGIRYPHRDAQVNAGDLEAAGNEAAGDEGGAEIQLTSLVVDTIEAN